MDVEAQELFNHLLRMYLELSDKYKYVSNKLRILEQIAEEKRKLVEAKVMMETPAVKDEVVQKKESEAKARKQRLKKIREEFDRATGPSGPVPDQSE